MNPVQFRHYFKRSLPFPVIWGSGALLYVIVEKGILGDSTIYPSTGNEFDLYAGLFTRVPAAFLTGMMMGLAEVTLLRGFLRQQTFFVKVTVKVLLFTLVISLFLIVSSFTSASKQLDLPVYHEAVAASTISFLLNYAYISILVFAGVFNFIAYYISETIDSLGLNIVSNFFTGRYKSPKRERRIFMFLDMESSTTHAESLGNIVYYNFLSDYYKVMTRSIIGTGGEVYQYVGDEIVISWPLKRGLKFANCVQCYEDIRKAMSRQRSLFLNRYGIFPEFKAGIHVGEVTAGEIGEIKKDILYTGDVLNTTARIQALCSELGMRLLISEDLHNELLHHSDQKFTFVGSYELRGKQEKISIYKISDEQFGSMES